MKKNENAQALWGVSSGNMLSSLFRKLLLDFRKDFTLLLRVMVLSIMILGLFSGCNDEDETLPGKPWQHEMDQLRSVVAHYHDIEHAIADGYDNEFTGYRSQMGYHYLRAPLLDDRFELTRPEVLMYAPDANGNLQFVGVEYAVPIANMDNPPPAPEGFSGDADEWAINTEFNVWTLHVWVGIENPHGIFHPHNPTLP